MVEMPSLRRAFFILAKIGLMKYIVSYLSFFVFLFTGLAAQAQTDAAHEPRKEVVVNKSGAAASGNKGGHATAAKSGTAIKNGQGGGVEAKKGEVSAKSAAGKGAEVNKHGVNVEGKNGGGMVIEKGKFAIKSKRFNVQLGGK